MRVKVIAAQLVVFLGSQSALAIECTPASTPLALIALSAANNACLGLAKSPASAGAQMGNSSEVTRLRRDLAGFGIQYWGESYTAQTLAAAPHRALIIEASVHGADVQFGFRERLFSAEEVSLIRHGGQRAVFAYLNVSELAPYRNYWADAFGMAKPSAENLTIVEPAWYGGLNEKGEHLAAFWTPEWLEILRNQIDLFLERGYDGVFLDDVLHYYTWPEYIRSRSLRGSSDRAKVPQSLPEFANAMMRLILQIGTYARHDAPSARPDFALIVNGGAYIGWDAASQTTAPEAPAALFDDYVEALDAIAMENALGEPTDWATIEVLQQNYAAMGVPVLSIDFHSRHPLTSFEEFRARIVWLASTLGFIPYIAADELFNRLDPPVLLEATSAASAQQKCNQADSAKGGYVPRSE